jgi:hypothetical protein
MTTVPHTGHDRGTDTLTGGDAIDVSYHATVLPLLALTLSALLPTPTRSRP